MDLQGENTYEIAYTKASAKHTPRRALDHHLLSRSLWHLWDGHGRLQRCTSRDRGSVMEHF